MLLAENDRIIINDAAEKSCSAIESCELVMIADSGHCVLQENDKIIKELYENVDALVARLETTTASLPAGE